MEPLPLQMEPAPHQVTHQHDSPAQLHPPPTWPRAWPLSFSPSSTCSRGRGWGGGGAGQWLPSHQEPRPRPLHRPPGPGAPRPSTCLSRPPLSRPLPPSAPASASSLPGGGQAGLGPLRLLPFLSFPLETPFPASRRASTHLFRCGPRDRVSGPAEWSGHGAMGGGLA